MMARRRRQALARGPRQNFPARKRGWGCFRSRAGARRRRRGAASRGAAAAATLQRLVGVTGDAW
jgi:hypothetical protein